MKLWNTKLFLNYTKGSEKTNTNCGIFQGTPYPPLRSFCLSSGLSPIPASNKINISKYGCNIFEKIIKHPFYMNDLKLYAKNDNELEGLLTTIKRLSDKVGMAK